MSDREIVERLVIVGREHFPVVRSALIEQNSHAETAKTAEEFLCGLRVSRSRVLVHVGLCSQFSFVS